VKDKMDLIKILENFKEGFCFASNICSDSLYFKPLSGNKDSAYLSGYYLGSLFFRRLGSNSLID
jgi:hypothetical protein